MVRPTPLLLQSFCQGPSQVNSRNLREPLAFLLPAPLEALGDTSMQGAYCVTVDSLAGDCGVIFGSWRSRALCMTAICAPPCPRFQMPSLT